MKVFKCPLCRRKYVTARACADHVDAEHIGSVPSDVTTLQWLFNLRNRLPACTTHGKSILSGKPTDWNETTGKYERLADDAERMEFRKVFVSRMMKTYGKDTLLKDPEFQKKMLAGRKISGYYLYSDGKKFEYTGTYEADFIRFMDITMGWDSKDIFMPCPIVFTYISPRDKEKHFYIPDVYIESLKLVIEIKSSENKHYRLRDIDIERAKDAAMSKKKINFIKVYDKDYTELVDFIKENT